MARVTVISLYVLVGPSLCWSSSLETGVYSLGRNIHLLTSKVAFLCDFGAIYLLTYLLP